MSDVSDDVMTVTAPRHRSQLSDKIIIAFHLRVTGVRISTRRAVHWCSASMKGHRSRRWIARGRCCQCGPGKSSDARTITNGGTTSLFAALDVKAGTIVSKCMPRHRAQ
jgi:hypothetical protein